MYDTGFTVTTITSAVAAVLALVYRFVCWRDNRQREASGAVEAFDHAYEDPTDKTVSTLDLSIEAHTDMCTEQAIPICFVSQRSLGRIGNRSKRT